MHYSKFSRIGFLGGAATAFLAAKAAASGGPVMEMVNERPYDWATPLDELNGSLYTPNRIFFIRSHMGPPGSLHLLSWHLSVDGLVEKPLHLSLADLKKMPRVEVPALLQCSGNGRYLYGEAYAAVSHPAGAQWKYGGVGNAKWAGVRVRDILNAARLKPGAKFATNSGLDNPLLPTTPKFVRGIEIEKLLDEDTILAYELNGEPLGYYHGAPARLVVGGWAADHWVKWLSSMTITDTITKNFWTSVAYRYPNTLGKPGVGVKADLEHPVTALNVKSIITGPIEGAKLAKGQTITISGVAWSGDGAYAARVDISTDGGKTWRPADLGPSPGKFSWRMFTHRFTPETSGSLSILARATDTKGAVQPRVSPWNPSGYLWNAIHTVTVEVN
ncbi:MAG: molybdopterin-dependent oxidoreductase [Vulcanimicrobiaceae bacterium]